MKPLFPIKVGIGSGFTLKEGQLGKKTGNVNYIQGYFQGFSATGKR